MREIRLVLILLGSLICVCESQKLGTSLKNVTEADKIKPKKKEDNPIKRDIKKYLRECGANVSDEESDEGNNKNDGDEDDVKQQKTLSGMKSRTGTYPNTYGGGGGGKNRGTYPTSYGSGSKDEDDECEEDSRENRGNRRNNKNNRRNKRSRNEIGKFELNKETLQNKRVEYGNFEEGKRKINNKYEISKMKRVKSEIENDGSDKIMPHGGSKDRNLVYSLDFQSKIKEYSHFQNVKDYIAKSKLKPEKSLKESVFKKDLADYENEATFKTIQKRSNEANSKDVETFKVDDEGDFKRYKNRNDKRRGGGKRKKNDDYDDDSDEDDDDDGCEDSGKNRRGGGNRNNNRGKNNRNKNNNRGNKRGGYNSFGGSGESYGGSSPYGNRYGGGYGYGGEFGLYDGWGMYGGRLVKMMNATGIEDLVKRKKRDVEYDDARDPADVQCLSQCVLGYLEMLDDNRVPSETEVIKYLQNKISNSSLRMKTIREARRCFARLATTDTENGCQFSKSLAQCMKLEIEEKM